MVPAVRDENSAEGTALHELAGLLVRRQSPRDVLVDDLEEGRARVFARREVPPVAQELVGLPRAPPEPPEHVLPPGLPRPRVVHLQEDAPQHAPGLARHTALHQHSQLAYRDVHHLCESVPIPIQHCRRRRRRRRRRFLILPHSPPPLPFLCLGKRPEHEVHARGELIHILLRQVTRTGPFARAGLPLRLNTGRPIGRRRGRGGVFASKTHPSAHPLPFFFLENGLKSLVSVDLFFSKLEAVQVPCTQGLRFGSPRAPSTRLNEFPDPVAILRAFRLRFLSSAPRLEAVQVLELHISPHHCRPPVRMTICPPPSPTPAPEEMERMSLIENASERPGEDTLDAQWRTVRRESRLGGATGSSSPYRRCGDPAARARETSMRRSRC